MFARTGINITNEGRKQLGASLGSWSYLGQYVGVGVGYTKFVFNFQFEKSLIKYVFKLKKIIIIIIIIIIISSSIIISQYKTLESTLKSMRTRRRGSMRKT